MKYFDVWNLTTGNLVADSDSEADLLAFVREMVQVHGRGAADDWSLGWGDDEDDAAGGTIAQGQDLVRLALRETSAA